MNGLGIIGGLFVVGGGSLLISKYTKLDGSASGGLSLAAVGLGSLLIIISIVKK